MIPTVGPVRFVVPAANVPIAGGATLGPLSFRFPRPLFITAIGMTTLAGSRAELASLRLRIQDESFADIITEPIYGVTNDAPALGLASSTLLPGSLTNLIVVRPFMLQRPVADGDIWLFTLRNVSGAPIRPELFIDFEEGTKP